MYRITYEQGNGYHCGCCRSTWTETEDVDTKEEVFEWLSELEADKKEPSLSWGDAYDREVIEIREIKDENLTASFQVIPELTEAIIEKRRKAKEDAEKAEAEKKKVEKAKKAKEKEKKDREKLKELAEKYPEELA